MTTTKNKDDLARMDTMASSVDSRTASPVAPTPTAGAGDGQSWTAGVEPWRKDCGCELRVLSGRDVAQVWCLTYWRERQAVSRNREAGGSDAIPTVTEGKP